VLLAVDVVVMVLVEGGDRVGVADPKVDGLGQAAERLAGPGHVRVHFAGHRRVRHKKNGGVNSPGWRAITWERRERAEHRHAGAATPRSLHLTVPSPSVHLSLCKRARNTVLRC
jgi:hypothetical protein